MVFLRPAFRLVCVSAVIVAAPYLARAQSPQPSLENAVKATFLYHFTRFVEWPAPADTGEPFQVCTLADDVFVAALDRTIAGESVSQRPLVQVEPRSIEAARHCAILYIGARFSDQGAPLVNAVRDLPVLTVGDGAAFIKQGGAIGFVLENNRVRFDISQAALQRSGLKASSKLLRVARNVEGGAP
jgi:uncharacterized protein DUF4154